MQFSFRRSLPVLARRRFVVRALSAFATLAALASTVLPAFAAKPEIDCSKIRGVCYNSSAERAKVELQYGKRVGLNAVRFWLSPDSYRNDGDAYIKRIVEFIRVCDENGYKSMPILFNGNGLNPATIEPDAYAAADEYATAIVNALKDEPGLLMFDAMNEPLCNDYINKAPKEEREARAAKTWAFLNRELDLIKGLAPDCLVTVGYTTAWEIEESTARKLDVLSFHDYSDTRARIRANYALAKEWGDKLGIQVINSETGCLARANAYEAALEIAQEFGMGWILFNLMIGGRCDDEHGIFYPDGTIRDAGTIAAMFGCFRNRGHNSPIIPPNANREGKADRAIAGIRDALKEYTSDAFDYRRSDKTKLLDACEVAANLLEACELVPMSELPTAKIEAFRRDDKADLWEIRKFAAGLANRLKEVSQIVD